MNDRWHRSIAAAVLSAAVLALYWGTLRNPLVFDDASLTEEFLRGYAESTFRLDLRRFSYATFGWTYAIAGPDIYWLRLGNLLLHAATSLALFGFASRLLGALLPADGVSRTWLALGCAALFALHPVAAYGAAYLMQRSIVMATLFSVLALWLFLEGLLRGTRRWHVAACAAFFVAVFSKEHCVMLPAVAVALAVLARGASWRLAREIALPVAVLGAIALLAVLMHRGLIGVAYEPFAQAAVAQLAESRSIVPSPAHAADASAGRLLAASVVNQGWLFLRYLALWAAPWPGWMSIDLRPAFPSQWLAWPQFAGFLLWLAWPLAATWLLLKAGRRGIAGFAMLAPWLFGVTEFVAVRVAEPFVLYRSYLWMSLLPLAPAALLAGAPARAALAGLAVACALLVPATLERLATFSSERALWDDAVRKATDPTAPLAERPLRFRGVAHFRAGDDEAALRDFNGAIERNPADGDNWLARGTLHMRAGRSAQALADFDRALRAEPRLADALERRCIVLMRLGRLDEALRNCGRALALAPHTALNHTSHGMALALAGRAQEAEAAYRRALAMAPSSADTSYQYGVLLAGTGRVEEARVQFRRACAVKHDPACRRLAALR